MKIKLFEGGKLPEYKTAGASCMDCYVRMNDNLTRIIAPRSRGLVSLGFALALPEGYEAIIRPRSGNSLKGVDVAIGTIDSDYRGEIKAVVINNSDEDFSVHNGDRICQMKIQRAERLPLEEVCELPATERGEKGFGSTGIN